MTRYEDGDLIADLGHGRQLFAIEHTGPGQIIYQPSHDPTPVHLPSQGDNPLEDFMNADERRELAVVLRRVQQQLDRADPDVLARALTVGLHRAGLIRSIDMATEDAVRTVLSEAWGVT